MANNYAGQLPRDNSNETMQEFPAPFKAQTSRVSENASASSVITLGHDTVSLEVYAGQTPALLRWIATTDTQASVISTNYDHVIPKDRLRRFTVPRERMASGYTSVQGVNRGEGLYQRVAYMSTGVGSVLLAEFGQG